MRGGSKMKDLNNSKQLNNYKKEGDDVRKSQIQIFGISFGALILISIVIFSILGFQNIQVDSVNVLVIGASMDISISSIEIPKISKWFNSYNKGDLSFEINERDTHKRIYQIDSVGGNEFKFYLENGTFVKNKCYDVIMKVTDSGRHILIKEVCIN